MKTLLLTFVLSLFCVCAYSQVLSYPNGHILTHDVISEFDRGASVLCGGILVVLSGFAIVYAITNDITVVGIVDDITLPAFYALFQKGTELLYGY